MKFARATLQRLDDVKGGPKDATPKVQRTGDPIEVQFNPASLKLERRNNVSKGGATVKTTKRTNPSSEGATLSFELEFDTAEEGRLDRPADVRIKTAKIRQFVEQPADSGKPPPRVQFHWGTFTFNGIMDRVSEDLDYFAADGTPLRAKLSVSISEQDLDFEGNKKGPGARDARTATVPGGAPVRSGPGTSGTRDRARIVIANEGESAADVLTGLGLDPSAWRSAMNKLDNPLDLGAGSEVELGAEAESAGGVGVSSGFASGADVSSSAALTDALTTTGSVEAGFVLAAGGGIQRSLDTVLTERAGTAVAAARSSFATPPADARILLDRRALSYGRDVPLRARANAPTLAESEAGGRRSVAARARPRETPPADRARSAPWEQLPPAGAADERQRRRDARPRTMRFGR